MTQILDYSWARPSPQSCKDWPAVGVMRYLGPGNNGRDITRAEADSLMGVGLGVGLVWETSANRALAGYDAGAADASQAAYYADLLGFPRDRPIYFACDCDVSTSQAYSVVLDYFRGTNQCLNEARAYGEADVLDATAEHLGFRHGWQPASTSWSGNRISGNAGMLQKWPYVMNDQCDDNDVLCPDSEIDWLWGYGGAGDKWTDADFNRVASMLGVILDNRIDQFVTANLLWQDGNNLYEVLTSDGHRVRRKILTGELLVLRGGALVAEQPMVDVATLNPDQRAAFRAWPET